MITELARHILLPRTNRIAAWDTNPLGPQLSQLRWLLFRAASTTFGSHHDFESILANRNPEDLLRAFQSLPLAEYDDLQPSILRMTKGEADILWPGVCRDFAQSSGTSSARSKFIPVTADALRLNHYAGATDSVALYLKANPRSRLFDGKGLILGGSFESNLHSQARGVKVGDLSATLINKINPLANLVRIPDKKTALLADWNRKLPLIAEKAAHADLTNISGVPSWMLRVLLKVLDITGASDLHQVWPRLEVFFHGGINFAPYRAQYDALIPPSDSRPMHYFENYNASEGFFACQDQLLNRGMLLLLDRGVFFEFLPPGAEAGSRPLTVAEVEPGKIYELIITTCSGLWRYRIGDTVRILSASPLRISVAGRTKCFINAFGEELMQSNADEAVAFASRACSCAVSDYTAAPIYPEGRHRGRHHWAFEFTTPPLDAGHFMEVLDGRLKELNSDYAAKRRNDIFLAPPLITILPNGSFDRWLSLRGSAKLGGQRKIPRLSNSPEILESLLNEK